MGFLEALHRMEQVLPELRQCDTTAPNFALPSPVGSKPVALDEHLHCGYELRELLFDGWSADFTPFGNRSRRWWWQCPLGRLRHPVKINTWSTSNDLGQGLGTNSSIWEVHGNCVLSRYKRTLSATKKLKQDNVDITQLKLDNYRIWNRTEKYEDVISLYNGRWVAELGRD